MMHSSMNLVPGDLLVEKYVDHNVAEGYIAFVVSVDAIANRAFGIYCGFNWVRIQWHLVDKIWLYYVNLSLSPVDEVVI